MRIFKIAALFAAFVMGQFVNAGPEFFELPPIRYSKTASQDAVASWEKEIASGEYVAPKGGPLVFLRAVLERLNIPEESQVLVFSKTSLQTDFISLRNPRAIYFSEDAYVGWVPGGKIEVIIEDEKLGPVFYILTPPLGDSPPRVTRTTDTCLQCHASSRTEGVPGLFIRSVIPDENSHPILSLGTTLVDHRTPVHERWGGWYVTAETDARHLGNRTTTEDVSLTPRPGNLKDLSEVIDTSKYLQPTSDIVALMVLEHQCRVHNLCTKAKLNYQRAEWFQQSLQKDSKLTSKDGMAWKAAEQHASDLVEALLFKDEAELEGNGIQGGEAFQKAFYQRGVKDSRGKNLRRLKLYDRVFKYRCSYMVHSLAFRSLPPLVKERALSQLKAAVSEEGVPEFSYLSKKEKKIIRQFLTEAVDGFSA